jgi:hypothetical protein
MLANDSKCVFANIYIYTIHHLDQAIETRAPCPPALMTDSCPMHARSRPTRPIPTRARAGQLRFAPTLTPCCCVGSAPHGPSRVPIEPTRPQPSRRTSHGPDFARLSHFHGLLSHFNKMSAIFEFSVSHFATSLLHCSSIFTSVLNHFMILSVILL